MSYIGAKPTIGNFQICDAISVVNGQAAYTMQVGSANVIPQSANHMIVSLNGVIQKPNSSYTVSGATITFSSNLASGDVINFIQILGDVLDLGVPSDATVTNAKTNFVSTSSAAGLQIKGDGTTDGTLQLNCSQNSHGIKLKSPAHSASASYTLTFPTTDGNANEFLQSNGSGVLTWAEAGGGGMVKISTVTASNASSVDFDNVASTYKAYTIIGANIKAHSDATTFECNFGSDGNTYAAPKTSLYAFQYNSNSGDRGIAQGSASYSHNNTTGDQVLGYNISDETDHAKGTSLKAFFGGLAQGGLTSFTIEFNHYASNNYSYCSRVTGQVLADVDCIRFLMGSGNISGTFTLYGMDQ